MENLNAEQIRYKMSEKQIKTALECLSKPNSSPADREKCYFMWKEPSCFSCYHEVAQNALALINSQEQRTKELVENNERLRAEQSKIKRKILMEVASKFAGHSDYHGDAILCKLICMSEGKEVGVAKPIDEVRRKETRADTVKEMQERLKAYFGTYVLGYKIPLSEALKAVNQIAKEMLEGEK